MAWDGVIPGFAVERLWRSRKGGGDWVVGLQKGTKVANDRVLLLRGEGNQADRVLLHRSDAPEVVYGRVGQVGQR